MKVAIIDYGSGNLHSAGKAFERAAREAGVAADISITSDSGEVRDSDRVVLPGVGAFADCRQGLDAVDGMLDALEFAVRDQGRPFLGICVGAQLLATRGLEKTTTAGFDWIKGDVVQISPSDPAMKIPQMGWNSLEVVNDHPLLHHIPTGESGWHAYFVHSYHIRVEDPDDLIAVTDYGGPVTAIVGRDNIVGTQFHPEKSQKLGLRLIANFLTWKP